LARTVFAAFFAGLCGWLGRGAVEQFIVGVFSDSRTTVTKAELRAAAAYYPDSSILQELVAESELVEATDHEAAAARAVAAASRAVELSPWRYDLRALLASAQESGGDRAAAEASLREAIRLAPHNGEAHWRMANLLVRENNLAGALDHFRVAIAAEPARFLSAINLVWSVSGGSAEAVGAVVGDRPDMRLSLSRFLLKQGRLDEASDTFTKIDRQARLRSPEAANFLGEMDVAGAPGRARKLWAELVTGKPADDSSIMWNGGFEEELGAVRSRFDWEIADSKYASAAIDPAVGHTGARSLRLSFTGLDTTTLDGEFKQTVLVRPGAHYRLECSVRTGNLVTSEGPQFAVTRNAGAAPIAVTAAVQAGSNDWRPLTVEFVTPADAKTLEIRIMRHPKFVYDDPTSGTIWFDDFALSEVAAKRAQE
jgi:tetratricopeptide (TPR) repeat protein